MSFSRIGRPSITNLDLELGNSIFQTILSTPKPNREKLGRQADEILARFLEADEKRRNKSNDTNRAF